MDRYKKPYRKTHHFKRKAISLRERILDTLGRKCTCCGETRRTMLEIDHVFNDGAEHRREVAIYGKRTISAVYEDILKHIQAGSQLRKFQILCCNCNASKHRNGGRCEHVQERWDAMSDEEWEAAIYTRTPHHQKPLP